jgi:hypothetical protein
MAATGQNLHPGGDQLVSDMSGRAGIPRAGGDARSFGKYVVATVSDLAKLRDGLGKIALLGGVSHRGAVQERVPESVRGHHDTNVSNFCSILLVQSIRHVGQAAQVIERDHRLDESVLAIPTSR